MKQILFFLLLFYAGTACAQWPAAPNKIRLGNQTTGDGLIYRSDSLPNYTPTSRNNAWFHFDTIAKKLYFHEGGTWQEFTSGGGESIYTDSGTVAPIDDMLVRLRPDTTFAIGECVGCDGFVDFWTTPGPGNSFNGFYYSPDYWNATGIMYAEKDSTMYGELNLFPGQVMLRQSRRTGPNLRYHTVTLETGDGTSATGQGIKFNGQSNYGTYYSYQFPYSDPSITLGQKSIMTWTGDGSFPVPAFEAFTGGGIDSTTASNGLTETANNIKLGGALTENTTLTGGAFTLTATGSMTGSGSVFSATNSSSGRGITGTSSTGTGVYGISTSGNGVYAQSTSGTAANIYSSGGQGMQVQSDVGLSADLRSFSSSANTPLEILRITSGQSSGNAVPGHGGAISFYHDKEDAGFAIGHGSQVESVLVNGNTGDFSAKMNFLTSYDDTIRNVMTLQANEPLVLSEYTTNNFIGTGWARLAVQADGTVVADTTTTTGGGVTASIYTDSGTVAPIADMLVRLRPDTTFAIAECDGCTGFENFWDNYSPGSSFRGVYDSPSYWSGFGSMYAQADSNVLIAVEIQPASDQITFGVEKGFSEPINTRRLARISTRANDDRNRNGIFISGQYFADIIEYKLADENPSFDSGVKQVMTWTGDGAGFAVPAFEDYAAGTWLKPELEAGDVTINSAGNTLALNVTNSSSPTFTPAIRVQHDGGTDDVYATGFEMADTTGTNYVRMYHENGSYRIEGGTGVTIQAADTTGVVIMRSGQTDAQVIGGVNGALRVRAGYAEPGRVLLTDYTQSQGVSIASPDTVSAAWTLTLPAAAPTNGQVLTANGATGVTTWATPATGGVTGSGTTNTIPVWSGATALGDSPLTVSSGNVTATGTGAFSVPVGTTAQQPGTPTAGMTRYNSTNGALEYRGASAWEVPVKSATATGLGTAGRVFYADAAGRAAANDNFYWDATNDRIGIGTASPAYDIESIKTLNSLTGLNIQNTTNGTGARVFFGASAASTTGTNIGLVQAFSPAYTTSTWGGSYVAGGVIIGRYEQAAGDGKLMITNSAGGASGTRTIQFHISSTASQSDANMIARWTTSEIAFNSNSADTDFRVESDGDANNIFSDAGNNRVGIGTATPQAKLHVAGSFSRGAPVTKTGNFTVAATENWLIVNNASANTTVTLPTASTSTGRELMLKNLSGTYTVISNASNVVPIDGTAAGTAILPATAGAWATLVSDGTNWIIMQQ